MKEDPLRIHPMAIAVALGFSALLAVAADVLGPRLSAIAVFGACCLVGGLAACLHHPVPSGQERVQEERPHGRLEATASTCADDGQRSRRRAARSVALKR